MVVACDDQNVFCACADDDEFSHDRVYILIFPEHVILDTFVAQISFFHSNVTDVSM